MGLINVLLYCRRLVVIVTLILPFTLSEVLAADAPAPSGANDQILGASEAKNLQRISGALLGARAARRSQSRAAVTATRTEAKTARAELESLERSLQADVFSIALDQQIAAEVIEVNMNKPVNGINDIKVEGDGPLPQPVIISHEAVAPAEAEPSHAIKDDDKDKSGQATGRSPRSFQAIEGARTRLSGLRERLEAPVEGVTAQSEPSQRKGGKAADRATLARVIKGIEDDLAKLPADNRQALERVRALHSRLEATKPSLPPSPTLQTLTRHVDNSKQHKSKP